MTGQHAMTVSMKHGEGPGRAAHSTLPESALRVYTLPGRHSWPYLSAPLQELRKLHAALARGGVRSILLDTGAYRLMVRGGADRYPAGFLAKYRDAVAWLSRYARARGVGGVWYVVPDVPYNPDRSVELAYLWLERYARGLQAQPVLVLHPACRSDPGCYREGLRAYAGGGLLLYGGDVWRETMYGLVQLDRRRPLLSARGILEAWRYLDRPSLFNMIHLLGSTLRLAWHLSREARSNNTCIKGLVSADTSSWYWDRHYGRSRKPEEYLSLVARLLAATSTCNWGVAPLTRWLHQSTRHTSIVEVSGGG